MTDIEQWVSSQIEANRPEGAAAASGAFNAVDRLAKAAVRLAGEGSGTVFGLEPPDDLLPNEGLYREACGALAEWLESLEADEGADLAAFVRRHGLAVDVPERFAVPETPRPSQPNPPNPREIEAMRQRLSPLEPMWGAPEWGRLLGCWEGILRAVREGGGEIHEELTIEEPATPEQLAGVERDLGRPIPEALLRVFLTSRAVRMSWSFPEGAPCARGGYEVAVWSADDLPGLYGESRAWALDEADARDRLWVEAVPWAGIDGSYLALDGEAVVFLEHEGDRLGGHGAVLAHDICSFVEAWTRCGCPDGGDWTALSPFLSGGADGGLDASSDAALRARAWLRERDVTLGE